MRWTAADVDHAARNRATAAARQRGTTPPIPLKVAPPRLFGGGMVEFTVPGVPVPKARPRFGKGRTYTPAKTVRAERAVAAFAALAGCVPIVGAVWIDLTFYLPIPVKWSKAQKIAARCGDIRPVGKPDLDNMQKLAADALNGVGYADDAQIVRVSASKFYSDDPRTVVRVTQISEESA